MSDSTLRIRAIPAREAAERVPELCAVLMDCVEGGASVSFMAPLTAERAAEFWHGVVAGVERGDRILLVAEDRATGEILGTVQVVFAGPENQPHRADVAKMLVHRRTRRRGVGAALLRAVDREAAAVGRSVLVLDTVTGSDAERLYARQGWVRVGVVPDYALMPDGRFCDTTFFYKRLAPRGEAS